MLDFFEKYSDRITPEPMSGCWLWIGSWTTSGYGNLTRYNRSFYAHRCAYESRHGIGSADNLVVRHKCDNPCCCNPDHLEIGTPADNCADAWARGRMQPVRGEKSGRSILTEQEVIAMRQMAADGVPICDIAEATGHNRKRVEYAVRGLSWQHLPGAVPFPRKKPPTPPALWGERAPNARLSDQAVEEIRSLRRSGHTCREIAEQYGIAEGTVFAIMAGRTRSRPSAPRC